MVIDHFIMYVGDRSVVHRDGACPAIVGSMGAAMDREQARASGLELCDTCIGCGQCDATVQRVDSTALWMLGSGRERPARPVMGTLLTHEVTCPSLSPKQREQAAWLAERA